MKKFSKSVKYVGTDDKTIDLFESQYLVPNGISYNSYLIVDEKVAIMDTVDKRKTDEWLENLDRELNADAYICPGLGDAGDRIFGTK